MTDGKSHTEEGQIQRAQRLRAVIENLATGKPPAGSAPEDGSLKEQIEDRARKVKQGKARPRK